MPVGYSVGEVVCQAELDSLSAMSIVIHRSEVEIRPVSICCVLEKDTASQPRLKYLTANRPFPRFTSVCTNSRTRMRLGWTFSYVSCLFIHPDLESTPLFIGGREWSIGAMYLGPYFNYYGV